MKIGAPYTWPFRNVIFAIENQWPLTFIASSTGTCDGLACLVVNQKVDGSSPSRCDVTFDHEGDHECVYTKIVATSYLLQAYSYDVYLCTFYHNLLEHETR